MKLSKPPELRQVMADFLGLKTNMLVLLAMVVLVGLGEKMAERFLPLYLDAPDEERLAHGFAIYDALYAWCQHQLEPETRQ